MEPDKLPALDTPGLRRCAAVVEFFIRRRVWIVVIVALLTLAGLWRFLHLEIDADVLHVLGENDPAVASYLEFQERAPITGALFIVPHADDNLEIDPLLKKIEAIEGVSLAERLSERTSTRTVLMVRVDFSPADIDAIHGLIRRLDALAAAHDVEFGYTGTPAVVLQGHLGAMRDLRAAAVISLVGVSLFFLLFYRAGWLALLSLIPIGVGVSWGIGIASLFVDSLSIMSATLPSLLIGLGIDYCIHIVQASSVRLRKGGTRREVIVDAWAHLLQPLAVGAFTTAGAFMVLGLSHIQGLREMGFIAALTILGVFVACLVLMPIILSWCPARWLAGRCRMSAAMRALAGPVMRHAGISLAAGALITVVGALGLAQLRLETDNSKLEDPDLPARILQEDISESMNISTAPVVLTFESMRQAFRFKYTVPTGPGRRILSIATPLPIEQGWALVVHPAGNPYARPVYDAAVGALHRAREASGIDWQQMTGAPVINARITDILRRDWMVLLIGAGVVVLVVLLIGSGGVLSALLALVPLACGLIWTGGFMGWIGHNLSVMGAAVGPLVLGIGVDHGVHLLMAMKRQRGQLTAVFEDTGVAVLATTVTTVCAFGAFCTANTPGLVQFGWQASFGLTACLVSSLLILPPLCKIIGYGPMKITRAQARADVSADPATEPTDAA